MNRLVVVVLEVVVDGVSMLVNVTVAVATTAASAVIVVSHYSMNYHRFLQNSHYFRLFEQT